MSLEALVRRVDEDRWLAAQFAPEPVTARLIALYALNYEVARTAEVVATPALGDIRLRWWRDRVAEAAQGATTNAHPVLVALQPLSPGIAGPLDRLIEAREADLEARPFADIVSLEAYVDATAAGLMRAAASICGAEEGAHEALLGAAGRAWGFAGLARAAPFWRARGASPFPGDLDDEEGRRLLLDRAATALAQARKAEIPAPMFAAVGYSALIAPYLRGEIGSFRKRVRLLAAVVRGRL